MTSMRDSTAKLRHHPFWRFGLLILGCAGAVALLFPGVVKRVLRSDQFMPHATCYLRNPEIILLHVSSDLMIGLSYVAISTTLAYLVYRASEDIPFHWMFLAFGLFILTCGLTHFMEVWTVWQAQYWLAGYVKVVCAAASVTTAIALYRLVPQVFALINTVKVSEQRREQLVVANAELEAFAYSVSHDLRAPLRAVQGLAVALSEDHGTSIPAEGREYLDRILSASQRMDLLIRDLLDYSRVSRADFELAPVDLDVVMVEARNSIGAEGCEPRPQFDIPTGLPTVKGNRTLLLQVLTNLLSNAAKFVAPGVRPRVQVMVREKGEAVRITVRDNGIGIAPAHRDKIFRVFERLHGVSEYPGTGIGLAIVQKAMMRMKGQVGFESAVGEGSCFWIELPKA
jgi:signal transduction histidine kinase